MSPKRIQLRRTTGWRKPEGAVVVARPTRWGNPILLSDIQAQYPSLFPEQIATLVVRDFRALALRGELHFPNWRSLGGGRGPVTFTYPGLDEIRAALAGRDLACWCPLDQPCHADVLLELANPTTAGLCLCGHTPDRHDHGRPAALGLCIDCDCPTYQEAPE